MDDVALIDVAGTGQLRAAWTNVDIALLIEHEVGSLESPTGVRRLSR